MCVCVYKRANHSPATCISAGPVVSLSEWHLRSPMEPSGCVPHTCEKNQPGFGSDSHQTASLPTHTHKEKHTLTHTLRHRHQIQTAQTELFPEANIWHLTNSEATEWCFALRLFKHNTESSLKTSVYKAMDSYEEKTVLLLLITLKSHWMWFQMCVCVCIYLCGTVPWI